MKHLAVAVTPVAGQLDLKKVAKRWVPRKLRWPIRWSHSVRQDTWLGISSLGQKTSANDYRAPAQEFALFMFPAASADWISNWRQAIWQRSSMPNLLISPAAIKHYCRMQVSGTFGLLPAHLTFRFMNTPSSGELFLDIRFQHFGINEAGIHIARFCYQGADIHHRRWREV